MERQGRRGKTTLTVKSTVKQSRCLKKAKNVPRRLSGCQRQVWIEALFLPWLPDSTPEDCRGGGDVCGFSKHFWSFCLGRQVPMWGSPSRTLTPDCKRLAKVSCSFHYLGIWVFQNSILFGRFWMVFKASSCFFWCHGRKLATRQVAP